jgi:acyl carrier protein
LVKIRDYEGSVIDEGAFAVHLVSDLRAIRPLYGALSSMFSYQEAGYMGCLLEGMCAADVGLRRSIVKDTVNLAACLGLDAGYQYLFSFAGGSGQINYAEGNGHAPVRHGRVVGQTSDSVFRLPAVSAEGAPSVSYRSRKSYRAFHGKGPVSQSALAGLINGIDMCCPDAFHVYLYVKEDKISDLPAGAYYVNVKENILIPVAPGHDADARRMFPGNEPLYDAAGLAVMLATDENTTAQEEQWYMSGYLGQILMHYGLQHNIGLCAIGGVEPVTSEELLRLNGQRIVHSFLGGLISASQAETWDENKPAAMEVSATEMLKAFLSMRLPGYMVPRHYVQLQTMPLTSNGKVDRKILLVPDIQIKEQTYVAPANPTEERLVALWAAVLGCDRGSISVNGNFFELGGHSIKAIELGNKINAAFQIQIPFREIFVNDTVRKQCDFIETNKWLFNESQEASSGKFEVTI